MMRSGRILILMILAVALAQAARAQTSRRWDFEDGTLQGWVKLGTGTAFDSQPTYGNNVSTSRALQRESRFTEAIAEIGGDYWRVPFPIGVEGEYWIGTYENRPDRSVSWATVQGDSLTGTLVSPSFTLDRRYIHFLIGGGCNVDQERIEVQYWTGTSWLASTSTRRTGRCDERMDRVVLDFSLPPNTLVRLAIQDTSSSAWGHINIDDVWVTDVYPTDIGRRPLWGLADTHAHPMAELAFGGQLIWGDTDDLTDEQVSAATCPATAHGNQSGKSASNVIATMEDQLLFGRKYKSLEDPRHTSTGALNSRWSSLTHQQMYEKWLKRAYQGGLRLLVAEAVNNRLLDWAMSNTHPDVAPGWDMTSVDLQLNLMQNLMARNAGWMELARTSAEARDIIQRNKLAIVLGIEVDSFANCDRSALPTNDGVRYHAGTVGCPFDVDAILQRYHDRGVRQLHPVHLADNAFGGTALQSDLFNISQHYLNGGFFSIADGSATGVDWKLNSHPEVASAERFGDIIISKSTGPGGHLPQYETSYGHINARGLTSRGESLLRGMMRRGMVIAVDHMSERTLDTVIGTSATNTGIVADPSCRDLGQTACQELAYPVALTHSGARDVQFDASETSLKNKRRSEAGKRISVIRRIYRTGGIVAPGIAGGDLRFFSSQLGGDASNDVENTCGGSSRSFAQSYKYLYVRGSSTYGVPIGTDFNGLNGSVPPRYGLFGCWSRSGHTASMDGVMAMTMPDPGLANGYANAAAEGVNDFDQRRKQVQEARGVNYEHYDGNTGVAHTTSFEADHHRRRTEVMRPDTARRPLIAARKLEGSTNNSNFWDINFDGMAHYGMLPDFMQDLRTVGVTPEAMAPLFMGADAYVRMWEKAERRAQEVNW